MNPGPDFLPRERLEDRGAAPRALPVVVAIVAFSSFPFAWREKTGERGAGGGSPVYVHVAPV
jgi:hypothetical protein